MLSASSSTAAADGWKRVNPRLIQRVAPLTFSPSGSTATTMSTATRVQQPLEAAVELVVEQRGDERRARAPTATAISCWRT